MTDFSIYLKTDIINHSFTKNTIPFTQYVFKPAFIKSHSLPIKFNNITPNIKKDWNNAPLYNGVIGSNRPVLIKNKAKKCNTDAYKYISFPEIKNIITHNYKVDSPKLVKLNKNITHPIKSRHPDKMTGCLFTTEMKRQFKKYNSRFYKQLSKYSKHQSILI